MIQTKTRRKANVAPWLKVEGPKRPRAKRVQTTRPKWPRAGRMAKSLDGQERLRALWTRIAWGRNADPRSKGAEGPNPSGQGPVCPWPDGKSWGCCPCCCCCCPSANQASPVSPAQLAPTEPAQPSQLSQPVLTARAKDQRETQQETQ